ncbi:MAG TPA: glycosyltransferase family 39 protein [Vicinamibacterales bacterium]|nr:glycosyltransferase family 39 protein [Vicinamibacterales bacterium]
MITGRDRVVAVLIGVVATGVVSVAASRQGIVRDEAYYMKAGELHARYYEDALRGLLPDPLSDRAIAPFWSYVSEHPPLLPTLYGLSWRALHRCTCAADSSLHPEGARLTSGRHATLSLLSEVAAFRLPTALFFGWLCALVYLFFVDAIGSRWGAAVAALLMFAQPRAFFHAQTASFDLPVATLWVATTYAYWRALASAGWRPAMVTGVLFGLCLATKLQSFLLPVALTLHWAWLWARGRSGAANAALRSLVMMASIAPAMLFALWPWLWHDTLPRLGAYLRFHLEHVHYNFEYFGRNFNQPPYPWHEPLGMLVFTAPVVLLVLAATGVLLLARPSARWIDDGRSTRALWLIAGAVPVVVFFAGREPIYGETKHWLATMPFLALAAGYAFDRLRSRLSTELSLESRPWPELAMSTGLMLVVFAPAAAETVHAHPYGLSHYNALAGGPPGGADLGMNRQFWGYSLKGLLPWLNATLPSGAILYPHDWNHDAWLLYERQGELRRDLIETGAIAGSDAALVIHEKHFNEFDYRIWEEYGHVQPAQVLTLDGVPLVSVYLRKNQTPQER